ncbi:DUF7927 domain-containing protein [Nocardioides sambongensis]|uniref:DUF7927 domain-containing protein n=1 Tax=Nocardioides sambongensis TaxID=2589074 RepID=UPI00112D1D11|nr:DUF11 domain-containing protein [Nocardioides sambongensis]
MDRPARLGESVTITYTVTVTGAGDLTMTNTAFGPEQPCAPAECAPPPEECVDGVDPETGIPCDTVTGGLPALTIDKSSPNVANAQVGDVVDYTITVTNAGTRDFTVAAPATVVDDLGEVVDDASYNDDAAVDPAGGTLDYDEPRLVWSGALGAGESVTISYSVTVTAAGDRTLTNTAYQSPGPCAPEECPSPPEECVDGVDPSTGLACDTVTGAAPGLTIDKSAPGLADARIGDTVTYRIVATNVGPGTSPPTPPPPWWTT